MRALSDGRVAGSVRMAWHWHWLDWVRLRRLTALHEMRFICVAEFNIWLWNSYISRSNASAERWQSDRLLPYDVALALARLHQTTEADCSE